MIRVLVWASGTRTGARETTRDCDKERDGIRDGGLFGRSSRGYRGLGGDVRARRPPPPPPPPPHRSPRAPRTQPLAGASPGPTHRGGDESRGKGKTYRVHCHVGQTSAATTAADGWQHRLGRVCRPRLAEWTAGAPGRAMQACLLCISIGGRFPLYTPLNARSSQLQLQSVADSNTRIVHTDTDVTNCKSSRTKKRPVNSHHSVATHSCPRSCVQR